MRTSPRCTTLLSLFVLALLAALPSLRGQTSGEISLARPVSGNGLIRASDGNFYGTTSGSIFRLTADGVRSTLYSFKDDASFQPLGDLVEGPDGNLYGVTARAENGSCGKTGCGTIFQITPAGALTTLYTFKDEARPQSGLTLGSDGNLYGTVSAENSGSIFRITPSGAFTAMFKLPGSNGDQAAQPLLQGSDGFFYGVTSGGVIFKVSPAGDFSLLHTLNLGVNLSGGLSEGGDGNFYAAFANGGTLKLSPDGAVTTSRGANPWAAHSPVQLSLSESSVGSKTPVTLTWKVLNGFSTTMQQCYAHMQSSPNSEPAHEWSGKQAGSMDATTKLFSGSATITPATPGTYTFALTCGGKDSGFATLTVENALLPSTTTLSAMPNPVTSGQTAVILASVTGSGPTPTGSVGLFIDGIVIGSLKLTNGIAGFAIPTSGFPIGEYSLAMYYKGDDNYDPSLSNLLTVTLNKAPTATTMTATPNPVARGSNITLSATVVRSAAGAKGTPAGSVSFYYHSMLLGTAPLSAGVANLQLTTAGLPFGVFGVTAQYSGDSYDVTSTSQPVYVVIY